jgi:hypothetical protein
VENETKRISETKIQLCGVEYILDGEYDLATEAWGRKNNIRNAGGRALIIHNRECRKYNVYLRCV